ncbi:hypothetical protein N6H14_18170 [Paenibacillus sp. CC-CFT747]|nr:hypothetical protein N6H14_18170 [Paenibacillus sp. CC-CFT747]
MNNDKPEAFPASQVVSLSSPEKLLYDYMKAHPAAGRASLVEIAKAVRMSPLQVRAAMFLLLQKS